MADHVEHYYVNPNYPSSDPRADITPRDPPPLRDEYAATMAERRNTRQPSPPLSEASNAPSSDRGEHASMALNSVSPELLAQITERIKKEVVEHLKQTGTLDTTAEHPKADPIQTSSTNGTGAVEPPLSVRKLSTPSSPKPAPQRATVESPPPSPIREASRPQPARVDTAPDSTPQSPVREARRARVESVSEALPQSPVRESGQTSSKDREKPSVRFGHPRVGEKERSARTQAYRSYSGLELSTIDQKWGMLFDRDRIPTSRLGQFLRGLANHIIEEFYPQRSIVVTPAKMAAYYANHSLEREVYPLLTIFKSNSHDHISQLYQDLGCQHHMVQEDVNKPPNVPGLTPAGFAQWMTQWILAYPDQEACRLEKVVLAMPIDADGTVVDGKPERLPKQISRHLLPSRELSDAKILLGGAISDFMDEVGMPKRKQSMGNSPPRTRRRSSALGPSPSRRPVEVHQTTRPLDMPPSQTSSGVERDRKPYSGTLDVASLDNESSVQIERERQPYTAQPGNGKVYENLVVPASKGRERANSASRIIREPEGPILHERHGRTQSIATPYQPGPRPGGPRRPPSPPIQKFSQSTPLNINIAGASYIPPIIPPASASSFSHPSTSYTPATYTPSSYTSSTKFPPTTLDSSSHTSSHPHTHTHTHTRDEPREPRRRETRRSTVDESSRPPLDFSSPRDAEKWDRINEERAHQERLQDEDRKYEDRKYEDPKTVEGRYEPRRESSVVMDEDYYRGANERGYENGGYYARQKRGVEGGRE